MANLTLRSATRIPDVESLSMAKKNKIDSIHIDFNNLSEEEQVKLFLSLFDFAHKELPDDKNLNIFIVEKK